jgi:hypothetical protein
VRNAWTHVDWGVAGEHPTEAMWERRQCRRWRIREEGLDVIVKRALWIGLRMFEWRSLWRQKPRVVQQQTKVMVKAKLGAARSRGHRRPSPPAEMPS